MTPGAVRPLTMLLVEDNAADVAFLNEAVDAEGACLAIHVVGDGEDALRFLRREAGYADAPRPDVIVMDLNLPVRPGQEVLSELAADPEFNTLPVAILTSSTFERHLCDRYPAGRCRYFVKTDDIGRLQQIVRQIVAHARRGETGVS